MSNEQPLNLFQKIADVKANIDGFTKDTKGYNYSYVSGSQVLHKIRAKMIEHNLLFIPKITDASYQEIEVLVKGQKKPNILVSVNLTYTWINADNPAEQYEIPFYAVGHQDDASKALGTALTYSERYLLMKQFNIPTDEDDADAKQKKEQYAPKATSQEIGELKLAIKELIKHSAAGTTDQLIINHLNMPPFESMTSQNVKEWMDAIKKLTDEKIAKAQAPKE